MKIINKIYQIKKYKILKEKAVFSHFEVGYSTEEGRIVDITETKLSIEIAKMNNESKLVEKLTKQLEEEISAIKIYEKDSHN